MNEYAELYSLVTRMENIFISSISCWVKLSPGWGSNINNAGIDFNISNGVGSCPKVSLSFIILHKLYILFNIFNSKGFFDIISCISK